MSLRKRVIAQHVVAATSLLLLVFGPTNSSLADDLRNPSVGSMGRIEQFVLPGSEFQVKPITDSGSKIVLRIAAVFPHGDAWRYDLEFYGLEPGKYDLADYLERIDGTETGELTGLEVEILSLLPPGQIEPNELGKLPKPWLGGYRLLAIGALIVWILVMGTILFARRRSAPHEAIESRPKTLADYLKPRIERAMNGELGSKDQAELERMLIAFWKHKLNLEEVHPSLAIQQIKADANAGPLVLQLESWMHNSSRQNEMPLSELLEPYKDIQFEDDFSAVGSPASLVDEAKST